MHVCHFADTAIKSEYFRNLAAGLSEAGVRVSLIELWHGTSPEWLSSMPNVSYRSLNASSKMQYPLALWRLTRYLKDEGVDILHTHLFFAGLIGVLAKRLHRRTIIAVMRHHTSVVRMLGSWLHLTADKWMSEKADHVMTVSQAARDYMINVDGIRREDIDVVHLGFDFDKFAPSAEDRRCVRHEFGFGDDDIVIGYIANFAPVKGHLQLIQAFAGILDAAPNAKLFLVGRGMLDELRSAAKKIPGDRIVFAGWRDDIAACLNAMDIFVQPSLSEAFSQVLVEAMGVGLPVVATDVGGAREVVESGVNGWLVKPDNVPTLQEHILELCSDPAGREQLGTCGRQSVAERFTNENLVFRHLLLYERWMNERDRPRG